MSAEDRREARELRDGLQEAFPGYRVWLEEEAEATPAPEIIKAVRELIEDPESHWIHNHETLVLPDWDGGVIYVWSLRRRCLIAVSKVSWGPLREA
jgi:hypothetical protein